MQGGWFPEAFLNLCQVLADFKSIVVIYICFWVSHKINIHLWIITLCDLGNEAAYTYVGGFADNVVKAWKSIFTKQILQHGRLKRNAPLITLKAWIFNGVNDLSINEVAENPGHFRIKLAAGAGQYLSLCHGSRHGLTKYTLTGHSVIAVCNGNYTGYNRYLIFL